MPETDLALLTDAARAAGEIACRFFCKNPEVTDKPDGAGPVTEADLAVNAMLEAELPRARPSYGWLSEETGDDAARLATERQFIVDPIDGTRAFIEGDNHWAHSLAVVEAGRPIAAAVYLPMRDFMFTAAAGAGAFLNGEQITVSNSDLDGASVLGAKPNFAPKFWKNGAVPPVERVFRSSLAYRLSLVAQGRFDAMLTLRPSWEWDIAAGTLLVQEAGGCVTDPNGRALQLNNPHPQVPGVVAAGGSLHDALIAQLEPFPPKP